MAFSISNLFDIEQKYSVTRGGVKNMPSKEEKHIRDSYNRGVKAYATKWNKPHDFTDVYRQNFVAFLPEKCRVLDIGCGPGHDTSYFADKGFHVTGIDMSEEMVALATRREPRANFKVMDMRELSFKDNSFDGVWVSFAFLHIKRADAKPTLEEFHRILRENGHLCILVHTNVTTGYNLREISGLQDDEGNPISTYVQEWKQEDLERTLNEANFDVVKADPFTREGGLYPLLCIIAKARK